MSERSFKQAAILLGLLVGVFVYAILWPTDQKALVAKAAETIPTPQQREKPCGLFSQAFYKEQLHSTVTKLDRGWLFTEATVPYSVWQTMNKGQRDLVRIAVHCTFGQFRMVSENGLALD